MLYKVKNIKTLNFKNKSGQGNSGQDLEFSSILRSGLGYLNKDWPTLHRRALTMKTGRAH